MRKAVQPAIQTQTQMLPIPDTAIEHVYAAEALTYKDK